MIVATPKMEELRIPDVRVTRRDSLRRSSRICVLCCRCRGRACLRRGHQLIRGPGNRAVHHILQEQAGVPVRP